MPDPWRRGLGAGAQMGRGKQDRFAIGVEERAGTASFTGTDHFGGSILVESAKINLVPIFIGLGVVKDRRSRIGNRLKDDRAAVGTEVPFARFGKPGSDLANVLEMRGFQTGHFLGRERRRAGGWRQGAARPEPPREIMLTRVKTSGGLRLFFGVGVWR